MLPNDAKPLVEPSEQLSAAPAPIRTASYRQRALFSLLLILLVILIWWGSGYVFAYTDDAYLTSDVTAIAPEVSGKVEGVHVADNEWVRRGTLLFSIDPEPFRLALARARDEEKRAQAQLPVDEAEIAALAAQRDAAQAAARLGASDLGRTLVLARSGTVPPQELDRTKAANDQNRAQLRAAEAALRKAGQTTGLHRAEAASARAARQLAEWRLSRTRVIAPVDGYVTHLALQPGDTAAPEKPVLGIVVTGAWRVIANYKEYYLRHLVPGHSAWVWLDSHPWRFYRARIQGMAHGISREPGSAALVPYVSPTVDWIRLQRRFPVRLTLVETPGNDQLYMGADARVLVIY